jgi:hypothetical protein
VKSEKNIVTLDVDFLDLKVREEPFGQDLRYINAFLSVKGPIFDLDCKNGIRSALEYAQIIISMYVEMFEGIAFSDDDSLSEMRSEIEQLSKE